MIYRRGNPVLNLIAAVIVILYIVIRELFFVPSQYISCVQDGMCNVYRKNGRLGAQHLQKTFNPKEIVSYKCISHYISRKHGGYYVYSLVLNMKDETIVDLDTYRYRDKAQCKELMLKIWKNQTFEEKNSGSYMY